MYITSNGRILEILDKFVSLWPKRSQYTNTPMDLLEYVNYINGEDFKIDEKLFELMGTPNTYSYPLDFWKVKLIDDRLRTFHEDLMSLDEYEGLIELPYDNERYSRVMREIRKYSPDVSKSLYIGGGAALYIAGIINKFHDIDVFTTDANVVDRIAKNIPKNSYAVLSEHALTVDRVQFILREYKYMSQIPHGFDVGCCGVIFDIDNMRCYCTRRAKYCIDNMVNWLEPDRSSPTYIKRLCKYALRGFRIMLPSINGLCLNIGQITNLKLSMMQLNEGNWYYEMDIRIKDLLDYSKNILIDNTTVNALNKYNPNDIISSSVLVDNKYIRELVVFYTLDVNDNAFALLRYDKHAGDLLPKDPCSRLLLMACLGIYKKIYEYNIEDYSTRPNKFEYEDLNWTRIDPMKQLTGTFHVENIADLRKFYMSSPLVSNKGLPIVTKQQKDHEYCSIILSE